MLVFLKTLLTKRYTPSTWTCCLHYLCGTSIRIFFAQIPEAVSWRRSAGNFTEKNQYIYRKTPVLESLFDKVVGCRYATIWNRDLAQVFSFEFLWIFFKKGFHRTLTNGCSWNCKTSSFCITDDKPVVVYNSSFRRAIKNTSF